MILPNVGSQHDDESEEKSPLSHRLLQQKQFFRQTSSEFLEFCFRELAKMELRDDQLNQVHT